MLRTKEQSFLLPMTSESIERFEKRRIMDVSQSTLHLHVFTQ